MATAKKRIDAPATDDVLHPLTIAIRLLGLQSYMHGLNAVATGDLPAERIRGRWYVRQSVIDSRLAGR